MEEDVFNALQTKTAFMPGGFDRDNKIIIIVNTVNDMQLWNRKCLELTMDYIRRAVRPNILQYGVSVIVDAQKSSSRITRTHARIIYALLSDIPVCLYLVREEGFWEKHVDTCTKSSSSISSLMPPSAKDEPTILSRPRLCKYFDLRQLPEELGGTLVYNYDLWLQQRKAIDEFQKIYATTLSAMESLHVLLLTNKKLRPSQVDVELKRCAEIHARVQGSIETVIEMGSSILTRLIEVYAPATSSSETFPGVPAESEKPHNAGNNHNSHKNQSSKPVLPFDLQSERECIEAQLCEIEKKQTKIRTAWLNLLRSIRETRELASLADGVLLVTNWILNTAEQLLSQQHGMGNDSRTCETLRLAHNQLELECRDTYAYYAELLYKIDGFHGIRGDECELYRDLRSQRDFMQFVCRAFAQRLERRRNMLITASLFFRLVNEYFERTSLIFESLVMGTSEHKEFETAAETLDKLKESLETLGHMEKELLKEGEKLSDMLSMPVKDALGRDLNLDYSNDIRNIKLILDTTIIRRNIFSASMEFQKLTLQQLIHIHTYEKDAKIANKWMDDLYHILIKCHTHVGCNIYEIQVQKEDLQTFQDTAKSIYNYGSQLLDASQALRKSCHLKLDAAQYMLTKLQRTWHCLLAISQEHMTRLRVSSVFHRSVEDFCMQLQNLRQAVQNLSKVHAYKCDSDNSSNEYQADIGRRNQLHKYLYEREQLLLEVGRMVRLGRLLKCRLKEPFVIDAITGKSFFTKSKVEPKITENPLTCNESQNTTKVKLIKNELSKSENACSVDVEDFSSDTTNSLNSNESADSVQSAIEIPFGNEDSAIITVNPNGNNNMACEAVTQKLNEISEEAEQLDEAIRYAQLIINDNFIASDVLESNSNSSSSDKGKMDNLNSNSSEDWQSRSTEDESFVTASDGNFTQHSHSSSFQTASGRTSSHISSDKNSFDASDPDESTLSLDATNTSSQHSLNSTHSTLLNRKCKHNDNYLNDMHNETNKQLAVPGHESFIDGSSFSDVNESATISYIPEVSSYSNTHAVESNCSLDLSENAHCYNNNYNNGNNNNDNDNFYNQPNAAWRHSKYYENINSNKKAIKGFL